MNDPPATYLYALVRAPSPAFAPETAAGLPGTGPVRAVPAVDGIWMIVADAPRARYGEAAIDAGLKDLEWVSACAVAHEAVVERFLEAGDLLPLKLFTLFDSEARAREDVARRREEIAAAFERVAGCREWGARARRAAPAAETPAAPAAGAPSGQAYLAAKSRRLAAAGQARERAEAALAALAACARETRADAAQGAVLAEAAFLVARPEEERFQQRADELAQGLREAGIAMTLSGPWPAYHFAGARP